MYLISVPFTWHNQGFRAVLARRRWIMARVEPNDEPDFDIFRLDLYSKIESSYYKIHDDLVDYLSTNTDLYQTIEDARNTSSAEPDLIYPPD